MTDEILITMRALKVKSEAVFGPAHLNRIGVVREAPHASTAMTSALPLPSGPSNEARTAWHVVHKGGCVRAAEVPAALAVCGFDRIDIARLGRAGAPAFELCFEDFCALYDALVLASDAPLEQAVERSFAVFEDEDDAAGSVGLPSQPPHGSPPLSPPHTPPRSPALGGGGGGDVLPYAPPFASLAVQLPRSAEHQASERSACLLYTSPSPRD